MARLKFEMFPEGNGLTTVFIDENGQSSETWWGSPPESIDHVCIRYLSDRFSNCMTPRHEAFIKSEYKQQFARFERVSEGIYHLKP